MYDLFFYSCASVFPESPRWLLATDQIPKAKKSFQEFASRNGVYLQDETFPTVLAGKKNHTQNHLNMSL